MKSGTGLAGAFVPTSFRLSRAMTLAVPGSHASADALARDRHHLYASIADRMQP
jgi:hypothetical protein